MALLRAYLIRAGYDWLVTHRLTPYLLLDSQAEGVEVPEGYDDHGKIVLNLSPSAVSDLEITEHHVRFSAGFGGIIQPVFAPMHAVLSIYACENNMGVYAREDGPGLWVNEGDGTDISPPPDPNEDKPKKKGALPSFLRVIK